MKPYPHTYTVTAVGQKTGVVPVASAGLPDIPTTPPPEFDGPEGTWSPETLFVAALANCFVFTFRAVSRAAQYEWTNLECRVDGTLEKVDGVTRFSRFVTHATLTVPPGADAAKAKQLLERAEHVCLVANSVIAPRTIEATVIGG